MKLISRRAILAALALVVLGMNACGGGTPTESRTGARCAMCGVAQKPATAATVVLRDGKTCEYCCPHCAVMGMSLAEFSSAEIETVLLSDHGSGERVPADAASIIFEPDVVPCCAPGIIAFRDRSAAEAFRTAHGGEILPWREITARMLKNRCSACGMVLHPPVAIRVEYASGGRELSCCPVCALACVLDTPAVVRFRDARSGAPVTATVNAQGGITADPAAARFWIGMKTVEGETKPAGCHFNFVFGSLETLADWKGAHPEAAGMAMDPSTALAFARKARPGMEAKREERLRAAGL